MLPTPNAGGLRGHGERPLYGLELTSGEAVSGRADIGIRTVELDTTPDDVGAAFTLQSQRQTYLLQRVRTGFLTTAFRRASLKNVFVNA